MSSSRPVRTLLLAVAFVLVVCAAAPASSHPARLALASTQPVTVYGSHFSRHDRVRVTLTTGSGVRRTRYVRAGRHGAFAVTFDVARTGPCVTFRIRARGRWGRSAVLRHTMQPGCIAL